MAGEVNNQTTGPYYIDACTARGNRAIRVRVIVRNAAVWLQYGYGGRGAAIDFSEAERFLPPGNYSFDEIEYPPDGVRARTYTKPPPALLPSISISLVNSG